MKHRLSILALAAMALLLSGCAGIFNGLGSDEMAMLIVYRTDNQPLTRAQYDKVVIIARRMGIVLKWQLSSPFEAGMMSGLAYAAAGAGGGSTQGHYYPGADSGAAAGYTGVVYGLGGVMNGLVTASYANIHAIEKMVEDAIQDGIRYDSQDDMKRVHVVGAYIRSKNTSSEPARNVVRDYYTGPAAGTSQ